MSLVRWFRRYNKKLMAFVVIILMFIFIMPSTMKQLGRGQGKEVVAHIYGKEKITTSDLQLADQELEMLLGMRADVMLRSITVPLSRSPDLRYLLLGELLFEEKDSAEVYEYVKNIVRSGELAISDKQLGDIYSQKYPKKYYWIILTREAEKAGLRVDNDEARQTLEAVFSQLSKGAATTQQMVAALMQKYSCSEEMVYETYGKLLSVAKYAEIVCSNENLTNNQLGYQISLQGEAMDVNFVKFDTSVFADKAASPSEDAVKTHFEKYKDYFDGEITNDNPSGFGYKIPDRVKLEYMVLKVDDLKKIVTEPTEEEMQDYYQKNPRAFEVEVPIDANDPNSEKEMKLRNYSEIASMLSRVMYQRRISVKAEEIFHEAKIKTEAKLASADVDSSKLTSEDYKKFAVDYKAVADELKQKYNIEIYSGSSGYLSALDIQKDQKLGYLFEQGVSSRSTVSLTQLAFSVKELGTSYLSHFESSKQPKLYENIGPLKDISNIYALVRVVDAKKSEIPSDLSFTYDKSGVNTGDGKDISKTFAVKDKVVEDLKKLAAMEITKQKAEEFLKEAASGDWKKAVVKLNQMYKSKNKDSEPNAFEFKETTRLQRVPKGYIQNLKVQNESNPLSQEILSNTVRLEKMVEQLYSLIPADSNKPDKLPLIMEFRPDPSYYVIKDLSVGRIHLEDFSRIKGFGSFKENITQSQTLAAVHFNPENIVNRTQFKPVEREEDKKADPNEATAKDKANGPKK